MVLPRSRICRAPDDPGGRAADSELPATVSLGGSYHDGYKSINGI